MKRRRLVLRRRVGAEPDAGCKPPTSIDPKLARRSSEKLTQYIREGAAYGRIDYEVIDGVRYAFRFSQHPPDAGVNAPHPGVDYLVCGAVSPAPSKATGAPAIVFIGVGLVALIASASSRRAA